MAQYRSQALSTAQMLSIIRNGLAPAPFPKRIIIAGAGMSGLVAGSLLKTAGHDVTVVEASQRVGGRVYTKRSPFMDGLYLDVGAMRIPSSHLLVLEYIKKLGLRLRPFLNSTPNELIYANGVKLTLSEYKRDPDRLNFPVSPQERGKTAFDLLRSAIQPVIDFINQNPAQNWNVVVENFDRYPMSLFLRSNPVGISLSPGGRQVSIHPMPRAGLKEPSNQGSGPHMRSQTFQSFSNTFIEKILNFFMKNV